MSDPQQVNFGEWALRILADFGFGALSGLGAFYTLFRNARKQMDGRIDAIEESTERKLILMQADNDRRHDKLEIQFRDFEKIENAHAVQLSVLTTCQANIARTLEDLKDDGQRQNDKLDELLRGK